MKKVTTVVGAILAGAIPTPSDANVEIEGQALTGQPEGRVQISEKMAQVVQGRATDIRQKSKGEIYQSDKWKDAAGPFARDGAFSNFAKGSPLDTRVNPAERTQKLQRLQQQQRMNQLRPPAGLEGATGPAANLEQPDVQSIFDKFKPT
jgi:hypothetical protein